MLLNVGLSNEFWVEVVNSICYLVNRSLSFPINCRTPEEVLSSFSFNYANSRIFCCLDYAHVNEGKLEPRAKKCIFLRYANGVKWYKLWRIDSKFSKFLISRDVTFNKSIMLSPKKKQLHTENDIGVRENVEFVTKASETIEKAISIMPKKEEVQPLDNKENAPQEQQYCLARDRTKRQIKLPQRYAYADLVAYALIVIENIENDKPQTYHEAIISRESTQWIVAMNEEIESLQKIHNWKLVEKPKNQKIV